VAALTYQSILKPRFKYYSRYVTITASTNDVLTFREASGINLTATITAGRYTYGGLAWKIKQAMDAVGAATYTVRYSYRTGKYTLTSDLSGGATVFELITGVSNEIMATIGFTATVNGASSYTSDTQVPSLTTVTFTYPLRGPLVRRSCEREDLVLAGGRSESINYGTQKFYSFRVEYETPTVILALYTMLEEIGERGGVVQFYPDSTDTTNYVDVQFTDRDFDLPEMTAESLYRKYSFSFNLREASPNTGTLDFSSLLDRRPNS